MDSIRFPASALQGMFAPLKQQAKRKSHLCSTLWGFYVYVNSVERVQQIFHHQLRHVVGNNYAFDFIQTVCRFI